MNDDAERQKDKAWANLCVESGWVCRICGAVPERGKQFTDNLCDDCHQDGSERVGFSVEQMIQMLDAGITVATLLDLIGVGLRFACFPCLIIPTQQFGSARLGHYHGVIVSSDTTDRAVLFGITVHAHQVVPIGIIAEKVTEKGSMD